MAIEIKHRYTGTVIFTDEAVKFAAFWKVAFG